MSEIEDLKKELDEYWDSLVSVGDGDQFVTVDVVKDRESRWGTDMNVISRGPSGQLYRWIFFSGATEMQENMREDETVVPVRAVEKQITITTYVDDL